MSGFLGSFTTATAAATSFAGLGFGAPPSQKAGERPIAFALEEDGQIVDSVTLALRPEDFSRTDTSRLTVHHTLGGAWADNFGPGLPSINISGHTGWRGGQDGSGEDRWRALRDRVWNAWHINRKAAIAAGRDPALVKLIYADTLSGFAAEVAPVSLTLRRSRSRPLLIQYQMAMIAVDQNRDQLKFLTGGDDAGPAAQGGGFFAGAMGALARIRAAIGRVRAWVDANLVAPVRAFLGMANAVMGSVMGVVRDVRNLAQTALAVPAMIAQAGMNLFRTLAAVANLPAQIKGDLMAVGGAFLSLFCFILASRRGRRAYADYSAWYGASGCSSISGGRPVSPLAGTNPFLTLPQPASVAGLGVGSLAQASLATLATSDPVLRPLSKEALTDHLTVIAQGVTAESGTMGASA